jgi:arylsulfatase A-like enzyme
MKNSTSILALVLSLILTSIAAAAPPERPNVLLIAIDDLNDWVGCLGGHPNGHSLNIDRLARRGTLFTNAHCQAPICNPSRTSIMYGLRPSTTGVYMNSPRPWTVPALKDRVTLPRHFAANGYRTYTTGKIYHGSGLPDGDFDVVGPRPGQRLKRDARLIPPTKDGASGLWDFGGQSYDEKLFQDYEDASWGIDVIRKHDRAENGPFLLTVGFYRPHVPFYAPSRIFDDIPLDSVSLPPSRDDDRSDIPKIAWEVSVAPAAPAHQWFVDSDNWRKAVQAYLACIRWTDEQVGRLLDALDASPHAKNTIVVLYSDHGFFLGEKQRWAKQSLWERATKVPFIISAPGMPADAKCPQPAELLSIYPTLIDLCGIEARDDLEGRSVRPLLEDSAAKWPHPALTTHGQNNHAARNETHRYIRYHDGSEELYDLKADPNEWTNLANDPQFAELKAELAAAFPAQNAEPARSGAGGKSRPKKAAGTAKESDVAKTDTEEKPAEHQKREIEGWTVLISPKLLENERELTEQAMELLTVQLREITRVVPAAAVKELRKVPLWFSPPYPNAGQRAEYHPGAGWLRDNGRDPVMVKAVEFTNVRIFERETKRMPNFALHELAHAFHDRVLPKGFGNEDLKAAYDRAKEKGLYEKVERRFGDGRTSVERSYAMTNPMEYFAECSEAFFSTNDFFPFTNKELKEHDPEMFELLGRLWSNPGKKQTADAASPKPAASYSIVVSAATNADPEWKQVVAALEQKYDGAEVVTFAESVHEALPALRSRHPRYTCFVATPAEAGRQFVADVHRLTRRFDDDPYADTLWGILTGYDAANALQIARHAEPLIVRKVASGTEVALDMCSQGIWYDELVQHKTVSRQPGGEIEEARGPADTTHALADTLTKDASDLFVTSGHATERNWQIGYRYRNGFFRSEAGQMFGDTTSGERFRIQSKNPKVYLPIGNCLMGHINGPDAMALAWMNDVGVHQMIGYTVLTWYGYSGWGVLDYFVEQPGRYTLTEAFHANQHALVHRLDTYFDDLVATDVSPGARNIPSAAPNEAGKSLGLTEFDSRGLLWDRDTVAFYGDPAWQARMAPMDKAYDQQLTVDGDVYTLTITPRRGEDSFKPVNTNGAQRGGRPIIVLLDHRITNVEIIAGTDLNPVITDDFILIPNLKTVDPPREYRVRFKASRR